MLRVCLPLLQVEIVGLFSIYSIDSSCLLAVRMRNDYRFSVIPASQKPDHLSSHKLEVALLVTLYLQLVMKACNKTGK